MNQLAYHCRSCQETFEFEAPRAPKSAPCPSCGTTKTRRSEAAAGTTGTYRFSAALGAVVRVSSHVPGLTKGKSGSGPRPGPSCPPQGCGNCG